MLKLKTKRKSKLRVTMPTGLWQRGAELDVVWFSQHLIPCYITINMDEIHTLPKLLVKLTPKIDNIKADYKFRYISAVSPHKLWSKTLILPHHLNEAECEQHCEYTLRNELPLPLNEVNMDYRYTPLGSEIKPDTPARLDIFAVSQKVADEYLTAIKPIELEVLDHVAYCILRAFEVLAPQFWDEPNTLWIYQSAEGCIAIRSKSTQLQILEQTHSDLSVLKHNFVARYGEEPKHCVIAGETEFSGVEIPPEFKVIESDIPFIALGAALWGETETHVLE